MDQGLPLEERFPRHHPASPNCRAIPPRFVFAIVAKFRAVRVVTTVNWKMSRIALRQLGSLGQIPGVVKSSW